MQDFYAQVLLAIEANDISLINSAFQEWRKEEINVSSVQDNGNEENDYVFYALEQNVDSSIIEFLIEQYKEDGVDINLTNGRSSETVLHIAARKANCQAIKLFLDAGADPTILNAIRESALSIFMQTTVLDVRKDDEAAKYDEIVMVFMQKMEQRKLEVKKGIQDINEYDPDGKTRLFKAVEAGSVRAVRFLLKNGANPFLPSEDTKALVLATAIKKCKKQTEKAFDYWQIINLLLTVGGGIDQDLSPSLTGLNNNQFVNSLVLATRIYGKLIDKNTKGFSEPLVDAGSLKRYEQKVTTFLQNLKDIEDANNSKFPDFLGLSLFSSARQDREFGVLEVLYDLYMRYMYSNGQMNAMKLNFLRGLKVYTEINPKLIEMQSQWIYNLLRQRIKELSDNFEMSECLQTLCDTLNLLPEISTLQTLAYRQISSNGEEGS